MRRIIFMMLLAATSMAATAQQHNSGQQARRQQKQEFTPEQFMKEMKSFIAWEAKLTPEEADKFFPLLLEMQDKTRKVQQKRRELSMKAHMGGTQMSESQYEGIVSEMCKLEITEKQIEQTYYKKFHSVLSWEKVYKVRNAISLFHMRAIGMFSRGKNPMMPSPQPQGPGHWPGFQPGKHPGAQQGRQPGAQQGK